MQVESESIYRASLCRTERRNSARDFENLSSHGQTEYHKDFIIFYLMNPESGGWLFKE